MKRLKKGLALFLAMMMLIPSNIAYATELSEKESIVEEVVSEEVIEGFSAEDETQIVSEDGGELTLQGAGNMDDPYLISTQDDLQLMAAMGGTSVIGGYYRLENDIVLEGEWPLISPTETRRFTGTFDGQGHVISGLKISGTNNEDVGLFGYNSGTICNLMVQGYIEGESDAGLVVGENAGTVENCHTEGAVEGSTIGGIVGRNISTGTITGCTSSAVITGKNHEAGGVAGWNAGTVIYSGATGNVSGSSSYIGGLVGLNDGGTVKQSYAQGKVTSTGSQYGGLVGRNYYGTVGHCYASGSVNSNAAAGLVGYHYGGTVRYSYYNSANTGNRVGIPATTADLKKQETYTGWDFETIWEITDGYPVINLRGEEDEVEISGSGTEDDPYLIASEEHLLALVQGELPLKGKNYYRLEDDIALTSGNWTPIGGNGVNNFEGHFDGQGYTISGLKISGTHNADEGLFGYNSGTICNLMVQGYIEGESDAGLVVGENAGTVENCHTEGAVEGSTIGGIVGRNISTGTITGCTSSAVITGKNHEAGGVAGWNAGTVIYSGATGNVSGSSSYIGGLVGLNDGGTVKQSYAQGKVTSTGSQYGGLVGRNYYGTVSHCYASGSVNSNAAAGLVGYHYGGTVRYSYYNSANTGNRIGIPSTATELKTQETYTGWDFETIWEITDSYPVINLRGEAGEVEIEGDGTIDDPYLVTSEEHLLALTKNILSREGKNYYRLENDITLTSRNWTPIGGNGVSNFEGIFDGQGYTISNLKISGTNDEDLGLFGYSTGTIKNLTVTGNIEGTADLGLIVGENAGVVENCHTEGTVEGATIGGIVGRNTSTGIITGCTSSANMTGKTHDAGGVAGYNAGTVIYCGAAGNVSGSSNYIGGLVGINEEGTVKYSYAQGKVTSTGNQKGGLVGRNYYGMIRFCYAAGSVNNNAEAGLVGYNYGGTIRFSYYNALNSGNRIGVPVTTTQLKKQETYTGWDFEHIWEITDKYPVIHLRGEAGELEIEGDGSEESPYLIRTEEHLLGLTQGILKIDGKNYYRLENDIALTCKDWTPIGGNGIVSFTGIFDGQGYTISGLKISGTHESDIGLFGYNEGMIKNLNVIGYVEGSEDAALLVGENKGTVENCHTQGTAVGRTVGGVVARNVSGGTITKSGSSAIVTGTVDDAGGLAGYNDGMISMCWAKGNVSGSANYIGGLVGINEETVENCYARGVVTSTKNNVGGLLGRNSYGTVTNSYSTGKVNEGSGGGLIGSNYGGTITNSYYCSTTSFCTDTGKGEPLTKSEMLNAFSYVDWDFANVWGMFDTINSGFPFVLNELGVIETEETDFWYEAVESRKGYAVAKQDMQIFYKAEQTSTVEFTVLYKEGQKVKNTVISAVYDEEKAVFSGLFHIAENMQEITSVTANVTDTEGAVEKIAFPASFTYQMPLHVEGQIEVIVSQEVAANEDMRIELLEESGNCIFRKTMNGEAAILMNGLPSGTYTTVIYGGNLKYNEKTDIVVVQGLKTTVDLTVISALASIELEFYADGKKVSSDGITANFYDKTEGKSRVFAKGTGLNFLSAGDKIGYSISLSKEAQKYYRIDRKTLEAELSAGLNVIRVDLEPFRTTAIKVNVISELTGQPVGGTTVTVSQKLNGIHSYQSSAQTDSAGNCEVQVKDVDAIVSVSRNSYETIKKEYTYDELLNNLNFTMSGLTGIVEFNLNFIESQRISDTSEPAAQSLRPDKIELIAQKTGVSQVLSLYNWPVIYLDGRTWKEGDQFVARVSNENYATTDITATVNEFGNLYFEGTIMQQGGIRMVSQWEQGLTSGIHEFVLYDEKGVVVRRKTSGARTVYMYELPEGTYTLAAADTVVKLGNYPNLTELQNDEELAGKWTSVEVAVEDGIINETDLEIPTVTDYTSILNESASAITTNTQSVRIGDYIHVSAKFVFEDIDVEEKELQLNVPEGTKIVESALTMNGEQISATVTDGTFNIPVNKEEKEILVRYSVKVLQTVTVSELTFNGKVAYVLSNRTIVENLGKAAVRLNELTIVAPSETNYTELSIHGVAPKNKAIEIYDDNVLIAQTTSNKYGAYRTSITLLDKGRNSVHRLKAVVAETGKESDAIEVAYGSIVATIVQFDVRCNAHTNTVYSVKDPTKSVGNITFTYNPAYPVTFVARFDNNQGVEFVKTVIQMSTGEEIILDMSYNEISDYWEVTYDFQSRDMPVGFDIQFLPVSFALSNTTKQNALENYKDYEMINDFSDSEEHYGYETEITLDDANQTKVRSLTEGRQNVEFTPDDSYTESEIDGVKYYIKNELVTEVRNNIVYGMIEAYIKMEDGTYNLYRKGVGIYSTGAATYGLARGTASGNINDLESAFRKLYGSSVNVKSETEYALLLLDLLSAAEGCAPSTLSSKISLWKHQLETVKLFGSMSDAFDLCKDVINVEQELGMNEVGNKLVDKAFEDVNKSAQNVVDAMKDTAKAVNNSTLNNIVKDMLANTDMNAILSGEVNCEPAGESILKKYKKMSIAKVKTILDPSGYVYETFEDNRLAGVTAQLYFENDEGYMEFWDAEEYAQINPQITDSEGKYGWDVPEGLWQVVYSKEGYATTKSEKLVVPPPQLDVNIEVISNRGAQIIQQFCTYNRVTLVFDKYVQVSSLTNDKFVVESNGQLLNTSLEIKDENVKDYKGKNVVKSVNLVLKSGRFEEGTYQISVAKGMMTYSGASCGELMCDLLVTSGAADVFYTITIPEKVIVMRGEEILENGAEIYCNDRLQISAQTDFNEQLESLTINGNEFKSGEYYTVIDENLIVDVTISRVENRYRMAFDSKGGSAVATIENIVEGTLVAKPADPVKKYSIFEGWYIDEDYRIEWKFDTDTLNENVILYAKWSDVDYHITLDASEKTMYVGESLNLNASVEADVQEVPVLVWKSSNESILTVTQNGKVTAKATGNAQITVNVSGRDSAAASCNITVSKKEQKINVTDSYNKTVGDSGFQLKAELAVGNGDLTYESTDSYVAEVSRFGRVTIKNPGTAQIRVFASETEEYAQAEKVVVINVFKGNTVLAGKTEYVIKKGLPDFYLNVYLEEGERELNFESKNPEIVTVSEKGLVHPVAEGKAVITVTVPETERFDKSVLEVTIVVEKGEGGESGEIESDKLDFTECEIELDIYSADYTGSEICPTVTVTDGEKVLTVDTDYSVFYRNNIQVGTATVLVKGKGAYSGSVAVRFFIKEAESVEPDKPIEPEQPKNPAFGEADVYRIAGDNRYATSLAIAGALKAQQNEEAFDAVIIANGKNFPDALAGSYLSGKLNAPILMANEKPQYAEPLRTFIQENLKEGGMIYILGGTSAVPESVVQGLKGFEIKRLAGVSRYETNLLILEEAGVTDEPILVCTGRGFADSLSASATGNPILLVGKSLTAEQIDFMAAHQGNPYYVIGGESAVSTEIENVVRKYGEVQRIAGSGRYETSILVAETFFENPETAVLASAKNFPDGLCGGPLAMSKNAPLILTATGKESNAVAYAKANEIHIGAVLGGTGLISDEATNSIFESTIITGW